MRNIFSYSDEYPEMVHEVLSGSQDKNFLLITSKYGNQHFLLFLLNDIDLISHWGFIREDCVLCQTRNLFTFPPRTGKSKAFDLQHNF